MSKVLIYIKSILLPLLVGGLVGLLTSNYINSAMSNTFNKDNMETAKQLLSGYLSEARYKQNVEDLYILLTNIPESASTVLHVGTSTEVALQLGFSDIEPQPDGTVVLPGVISRKKQFIPAIMDAYQKL